MSYRVPSSSSESWELKYHHSYEHAVVVRHGRGPAGFKIVALEPPRLRELNDIHMNHDVWCVSPSFLQFFFLHFLLFFLLLHFKLYNFQMSVRIVQEQISQKEKEQSTQWLNINENRRRTCMQPATKAFFSMFFFGRRVECVSTAKQFSMFERIPPSCTRAIFHG